MTKTKIICIFGYAFFKFAEINQFLGITNKQIYICHKKDYALVDVSVYAARYMNYSGFLK